MKLASVYPTARERLLNQAGRLVSQFYGAVFLKMDVEWQAAPPAGAKIFAGNHPTTADPLAVMGLFPEPPRFLISEFVMNVPVLGWYLRAAGHVQVSERNRRGTFMHALHLLKAGRTLVMAPEGDLSPLTGGIGRPQLGLAFLALHSGAPVIPVGAAVDRERIRLVKTTVNGKTEVARHYFRGPYCVTFGEALRFDGSSRDRPRVHEVGGRVMQRISELTVESARRVASSAS